MKRHGYHFLVSLVFAQSLAELFTKRKYGYDSDYFVDTTISLFNCYDFCTSRNGQEVDLNLDRGDHFICSCQCDRKYPIYMKIIDQCTLANRDCKFLFSYARNHIPTLFLSTKGLISPFGDTLINYSEDRDQEYSSESVHSCHVTGEFYESFGWKHLFKRKKKSFVITDENRLKWIGENCIADNLSGLLISIRLQCQYKESLVDSCLLFRTNGTFKYSATNNKSESYFMCLNTTITTQTFSLGTKPPVTRKAVTTITNTMDTTFKKTRLPTDTDSITDLSASIGGTTRITPIIGDTEKRPIVYLSGNNKIITYIAGVDVGLVGVMLVVLILLILKRKKRLQKAKLAVQKDCQDYRKREILNQRQKCYHMKALPLGNEEKGENTNLSPSGYSCTEASYGKVSKTQETESDRPANDDNSFKDRTKTAGTINSLDLEKWNLDNTKYPKIFYSASVKQVKPPKRKDLAASVSLYGELDKLHVEKFKGNMLHTGKKEPCGREFLEKAKKPPEDITLGINNQGFEDP